MSENIPTEYQIPEFLRKCEAGDTIKMFVQCDPLKPPWVLFRYIEFKVRRHLIHSPEDHEIKFSTIDSYGQTFDTLILTTLMNPLGGTVSALKGHRFTVNVVGFLDASNASPQTIPEIVAEQDKLIPLWQKRRDRVINKLPRRFVGNLWLFDTIDDSCYSTDGNIAAYFAFFKQTFEINKKLLVERLTKNENRIQFIQVDL